MCIFAYVIQKKTGVCVVRNRSTMKRKTIFFLYFAYLLYICPTYISIFAK